MSPPGRAPAIVLLVLLLAGAAAAQAPPVESPEEPQPPTAFSCDGALGSGCLPDLIVSNANAESSDETKPVRICMAFLNIGDGSVATPFRVLLSIDGVGHSEAQFKEVYRRGEGGSTCWDGIPLPRGRHTLVVAVDSNDEVLEEVEGNNAKGQRFYVGPAPQTDLELTHVGVTPREGKTNDIQLFIVNVTNRGNAASGPTNLTLEDDNGMSLTWTIPAMEPGQFITRLHATRPDLRPVGDFFVRATIDPTDVVEERDEENNEKLTTYSIAEHPAPDYVVENVTIHGNRSEMRGVRVDATIRNVGTRAVQGTTVWLLNETNATVSRTVTRSLLYPNQTSVAQFTLLLPAGDHPLRVVADPERIVAELNETNNAHDLTLSILPAPTVVDLPNLVIERMYAMPEDPRPGEIVSVGALVKNVGTNSSNATTIAFLVDGDRVALANVPRLDPGELYSAYIPWRPEGDGAFTLTADVDPDTALLELEDLDNTLARDFTITNERPPASPAPVTPTPTTPTPTTPSPTTPTTNATPSVVVGELIVETTPTDDGAQGIISVSLRNPSIQPIGLLTVTFKVDDQVVRDVLIQGIRGASTAAATTGQIPIPTGTHTARAEVRIIGTTVAPVVREFAYTEEGGDKGLPGFEAALALLGVSAALVLSRRKQG